MVGGDIDPDVTATLDRLANQNFEQIAECTRILSPVNGDVSRPNFALSFAFKEFHRS